MEVSDGAAGTRERRLLERLDQATIRRHLLGPLAHAAGIPGFRRDYVASSMMAELRRKTLDEAVEALRAAGVRVVLLKGISYVGSIYADPAERPMSDIDLLVPVEQHACAVDALCRLGYWNAGSRVSRARTHHAVAFKRKDASIDLHRSIMQPLRSRIDLAGLWQRAVPAHGEAERLEDVDEAVIHLAHIARHELMVPLVNYVDAQRLLERLGRGAKERVLRRARRFRLARGAEAALAMTEALFAGREPTRVALPSTSEVLSQRVVPRPLQILRKFLLVEGPVEAVGLAAVAVYERLAHRVSRPR